MLKISPLSNVKPFWKPGCKYPSRVRLAMSDGTIRTYWDEPQQPKWKRWKPLREIIGYPKQDEYQPRHLKKTGGAATHTGR